MQFKRLPRNGSEVLIRPLWMMTNWNDTMLTIRLSRWRRDENRTFLRLLRLINKQQFNDVLKMTKNSRTIRLNCWNMCCQIFHMVEPADVWQNASKGVIMWVLSNVLAENRNGRLEANNSKELPWCVLSNMRKSHAAVQYMFSYDTPAGQTFQYLFKTLIYFCIFDVIMKCFFLSVVLWFWNVRRVQCHHIRNVFSTRRPI